MQPGWLEATGAVYMGVATLAVIWQFLTHRSQRKRESRDDLVQLLRERLGIAEREVAELKVKVTAQQAQIDSLAHLPFERIHTEHQAILDKLGQGG